MGTLTISKRVLKGIVVLDLAGKIKIGEGNLDLHQTLRSLVEQNQTSVLLNLARVSSIDSSGLGELVAGYTTLEKSGGELKLLNLTERVAELLTFTKLLTVFDIYDDEAAAIASFEAEFPKITQPLDQNAQTVAIV